MEDENSDTNKECVYPVLIIPKVCTTLESNCEISQNVFIHLNIQSPDAEGNQNVIYNGLCNIKLAEVNDNINIRYCTTSNQTSNENIAVSLAEASHITFPSFKDSQVWIDPSKSPFVYNQCEASPLETYTLTEGAENHITIEQHNTYITQNVYKYNEKSRYSPITDDEKDIINITEVAQTSDNYDGYEDEELECGVFLSQLSEDIIQEKETWARDERKFNALETDNEALRQLMSKNIQSASKQQKTILYLGHDAESGQTVQNISVNDPMLECIVNGHVDNEVVIDGTNSPNNHPRSKRYQCNKCKQLFDHIITFKQHMVGSHRSFSPFSDVTKNIRFMCTECGKQLKNRDKLEQHYLGHGDPELECNKCHKVFASKFTLRAHRKIHTRMFPCQHCKRGYDTSTELYAHKAKAHNIFICEVCSVTCDDLPNLISHQEDAHKIKRLKTSSDSDNNEGLFGETSSDVSEEIVVCETKTQEADLVIAKIKSNRIFHFNSKKKQRINDKTCEVCYKKFDRLSDLKRHLIEHVIRSTLSKNPVNRFGVLNIRCEICQEKVFASVDKYKAHLREHAKLTLYKCTFCDKSFSDSSNFSKHKKIHGTTFFQCDICQRKFNSKKMITQHMDYHNKNRPLYCQYCGKIFHFHSTLNKHIKCSHVKESRSKYKCRFCPDILNCLKEKWDHEWMVHNVRKAIVDCLFCGSRFRKYAELKKHCSDKHNTMIPPANRLLRWKRKNKLELIESD